MPDWTDNPDWQNYVRRVKRELVPKIDASAYVMSLVPEGEPDVKFAVELGLSIMMDKPIIAVVTRGVKVPDHLVRVADEIVEGDLSTEEGRQAMGEAIQATMKRLER